MKVAILAGGYGSRLAEETEIRPKPMVEVGGLPILLHIMNHFARYGHTEFVIALGYKGEYIKRYMADFCSLHGNVKVDLNDGTVQNTGPRPNWTIDLVETGLETMTGGRIKRLREHLGDDEPFLLTWGDGVSDVDLDELVKFHRGHGRLVTVTAVRPAARYGHLDIVSDQVKSFSEKPQLAEGWINGAFFVCDPEIFDYIDGDDVMWEQGPLNRLAEDGQLMAYKHGGFWQCMDTLREKQLLESMWQTGDAPWKWEGAANRSAAELAEVIQ